MTVAIIGLGSMGKRRLRLLHRFDETLNVIGIDTKANRRDWCKKEYSINTFECLDEAVKQNKISCVFICTAPLSHASIITKCLNNSIHVFTELNLVDDEYEKNMAIAKEKNIVLFISSTMLYRKEIKEIRSQIADSKCLINYSYHIGQYLPDWHPWENYADFFVNDKRSNGCREIFAIELPWLVNVFGDIKNIYAVKGNMSDLKLNYCDNYIVIIQHENGNKGSLIVDVVSRKPVRNLEVYGETLYLRWDGSPEGLYTYDYVDKKDVHINLYNDVDQLENYSSFVVENAYYDEIVEFFEIVSGKKKAIYDFCDDKKVLQQIDKIEA